MASHKLIRLWLIIGIVTGFGAIVFFTITYLNEKILCDMSCRMKNDINLALILVSLVGMFVGSLTYYFISDRYEKKIDRIHKDASSTLKFLDKEEREILKSILERKGRTTQSNISKDTNMSRVKVSRLLAKLEEKGIIKKVPSGMTNMIEIEEDLKELFLE